jgi:CheY-like chemotaxis protein
MTKLEQRDMDRRTAKRYRVPGVARVFWDGGGAPVSIADMSAGGCLLLGEQLPDVGTHVFLSLDIGGLPNVRLPALTVRRGFENGEPMIAVRFEVPSSSVGGLDKLLSQHVCHESDGLTVLVVDSDVRSRERIAGAVRTMGARVLAVSSAQQAIERGSNGGAPSVVLARADAEGLAALSWISRDRPSAFRVAFGRRAGIESALAQGVAQAGADDPCSAKTLGELLSKGRTRAPS